VGLGAAALLLWAAVLVTVAVAALVVTILPKLGVPDRGVLVVLLILGLVLVDAVERLRAWFEAAEPAHQADGSGAAGKPGLFRRWLTRAVFAGASGVLARRHERYVRSLGTKFQRRDWDAALRAAIGLGGTADSGSWLGLRLPTPRRTLRLRLARGPGEPGGEVVSGERAGHRATAL
jgi:hypothetical protein